MKVYIIETEIKSYYDTINDISTGNWTIEKIFDTKEKAVQWLYNWRFAFDNAITKDIISSEIIDKGSKKGGWRCRVMDVE